MHAVVCNILIPVKLGENREISFLSSTLDGRKVQCVGSPY